MWRTEIKRTSVACDICTGGFVHDRVEAAFGSRFVTEDSGRRGRFCSLACLDRHLRWTRAQTLAYRSN